MYQPSHRCSLRNVGLIRAIKVAAEERAVLQDSRESFFRELDVIQPAGQEDSADPITVEAVVLGSAKARLRRGNKFFAVGKAQEIVRALDLEISDRTQIIWDCERQLRQRLDGETTGKILASCIRQLSER